MPYTTPSSSSTENEYNNFDYREPTPPHEQINQITDVNSTQNSTKTTVPANGHKLIGDRSNQTHMLRKTLRRKQQFDIHNRTLVEAARRLKEQKIMQSLLHLIPPHLWAQIQNNRSMIYPNQTQRVKPLLPNPVLLAEAAAQAGLPGPGPYPIPDHLWHRNPSQFITRPSTTCKTLAKNYFDPKF